jgi:hypothetical protein
MQSNKRADIYVLRRDYRLTIGDDTYTVTIGQPEDDILVDSMSIGRQCAAGRGSVYETMRIVVARLEPDADWDADVAYEPYEED